MRVNESKCQFPVLSDLTELLIAKKVNYSKCNLKLFVLESILNCGFRMFITHFPILSVGLVFVTLFSWIESETEFIKDMKDLRKILNGFQV